MHDDTRRYLEHLCNHLLRPHERPADLRGRGAEPFALARELRFSPKRTKAVLRELMQHHLLDLSVVQGSDGRNELRLSGNGETERWYARTLRFRRLRGTYYSTPAPDTHPAPAA